MRNTISIKAFVTLLAMAASAQSQTTLPMGCYERSYSSQELANKPAQVIERIVLNFAVQDNMDLAIMKVLVAKQGKNNGYGGQVLNETLTCNNRRHFDSPELQPGRLFCHGSCGGGSFEAVVSGSAGLTIKTDYLYFGGLAFCDGYISLIEKQGEYTTYSLKRVADNRCDANLTDNEALNK